MNHTSKPVMQEILEHVYTDAIVTSQVAQHALLFTKFEEAVYQAIVAHPGAYEVDICMMPDVR